MALEQVRDQRDQDTIKVTPAASKRQSSVWGRQESQRSSQDLMVTLGISPGRQGAAEEARSKRQEAAAWVEQLTGEQVPSATDREFRAALRSGVVLCRVMNAVAPNTVKMADGNDVVSGAKHRYENVQNFIKAASALGVPQDYMCSLADLDYEGSEDRPRVADCVLWLRRLYDGNNTAASPARWPSSDITAVVDSPRRLAKAAAERAVNKLPSQSSGHASKGMVGNDTNISRNISRFTTMLQQKMTVTHNVEVTTASRTTADSFSFEAVGPVLEQVLGGLTQEYERRLLAKDQEINSTKDKLAQVSRQMDTLRAQMSVLQEELTAQQARAAEEANAANAERVADLESQLEALGSQLAEESRAREALQAQLDGLGSEATQATRELQQKVEYLEAELAQQEDMQDKYRSIQEENRKLYNQVQDLKGAIRVYCRIRPPGRTNDSSPVCIETSGEDGLAIYGPKSESKMFQFDRVFDLNAGQEDIYADTQPLIRSVLDGYNVCIFAYGQTGSGKTHTMSGTHVEQYEGRGINYRALDDLFAIRDKRSPEVTYEIQVQMLEIYNESLRDLLVENANAASNKLEILNTQASGCNVPQATKLPVSGPQDVLDMMQRGARNRHSAETKMNERSSRSHQVLTVIVDGFNSVTGVRTHGCLHLVDLAGSERTSKSEVTGDRMVEANHINSSLSALGDVMSALAQKQKHVPFRNSKLTQLLADSLSGQAKVMMFIHIAPELNSYQESTSTLQFASRVSQITLGQAKRNLESSDVIKSHKEAERLAAVVSSKDAELASLREALARERAEKERLRAQFEKAQLHAFSHKASGSPEMGTAAEAHTPYQSAHASMDSRNTWAAPSPSVATSRAMPPPSPRLTPGAGLTSINEGQSSSNMSMRTPSSARHTGLYAPSRPSLTPTLTMRENGRYGGTSSGQTAAVAAVAHTGTASAAPSASRPATSNGPPRQDTSTSLTRSVSNVSARLPHSSSLPRPATAAGATPASSLQGPSSRPSIPAPSSANVGSATGRTGGVYGASRATAASRVPTAAATPSAAAALVPASAGGRARSGVYTPASSGGWKR